VKDPFCLNDMQKFRPYLYRRTSGFMLFSEIMAFLSDNHTKRVSIFCGQNSGCLMLDQAAHTITIVFEELK
jgi:hypothetical protein